MFILDMDYRKLYWNPRVRVLEVWFEGHGSIYIHMPIPGDDPPPEILQDAVDDLFEEE